MRLWRDGLHEICKLVHLEATEVPAVPEGDESNRPLNEFILRAATADGLEDITRIHKDGFTEKPLVHYCSPLCGKYLEDHWEWTRKNYVGFLEQPQKSAVHVIETSRESDGEVIWKPAGLAIWNVAALTKSNDKGILKSLP